MRRGVEEQFVRLLGLGVHQPQLKILALLVAAQAQLPAEHLAEPVVGEARVVDSYLTDVGQGGHPCVTGLGDRGRVRLLSHAASSEM